MWSPVEIPLDMRKISSELKRRKPKKGSTVYVLTGSGSYSPPHRMHLAMFEQARKYIEETEQGCMVVGGFIVPSGEKYVKMKLGNDAIPLKDRVRLTKLVCAESTWIEACGWGTMSSPEIAFRTIQCLRLSGLAELYQCTIKVCELYGADTILRHYGSVSEDHEQPDIYGFERRLIILGRPGSTEAVQDFCKRHPLFTKHMIVVPGELEAVSSTEVRKAIRERNRENLHRLIQCESVEEYLMENISAFYKQHDEEKTEKTET